METNLPLRTPVGSHPVKGKPDARPMRLALGAGGLAALSALATAIVMPPRTVTQVVAALQQPTDAASAMDVSSNTPLASDRPVRYVQLLPGQTAPPGASVIPAPTPTPGTMVVTVPAPGQKQAANNPPAKQPANPPAAQATPAPPPPAQAAPPAPPPPPKPTPVPVKTTQSGKTKP